MTDYSVTTIDLLRHGQTEADTILRGRVDIPLSTAGYQQMQASIQPSLNAANPWQHIISSPLQRCARFARDLAAQQGIHLDINKAFIEMDFGDWDGLPIDQLRTENPDLYDRVWQQPDQFCPPNGETFQQFYARIETAWHNLLQQYQGQQLLLIAHGGVIRGLIGLIMQAPLASLSCIDVPYGCFSQIKVHHQSGHPPWPQLHVHNRQAGGIRPAK